MTNRVRINVKFGDAKVLVPCGDGSISVNDLIDKAVDRFKKLKKLHQDDQIDVDNLYQEADNSFLDKDDEVAAILDDKETVIAVYRHIPHDSTPDYKPITIGDPNATSSTSPDPSLQQTSYTSNPQPSSETSTAIVVSSTSSDTSNMYFTNSTPSISFDKRYSPVPTTSYNTDIHYGSSPRDFMTTPTNMYATHEDMVSSGGQQMDMGPSSTEYVPQDIGIHSSEIVVDERAENLSQIMDDFSHDLLHPHSSQIGEHSQISVHSEEGQHGTTQKYLPNTTSYEMVDMLTPSSSGYGSNLQKPIATRSVSQQSLDMIHKQGIIESPYHTSSAGKNTFSNSQSIERLHELQQQQSLHYYRSGVYPMAPAMYHHQQLSQDYSQDPPYYPEQMGFLTQPEMWNQRIHPSQMQQRSWASSYGQYLPHMKQFQFPPPTGGRGMPDPYDRRPDDYGYHGYPQFNDPRKRNSALGIPGEYHTAAGFDEYYFGRGTSPRYTQPIFRGWGKGGYEEDFPQRQREEDPMDFPLSQPASYSGRYPVHHPSAHSIHQSMGSNRYVNGPSGYSLSQPGTSMKSSHKQKKSALKNRNEQSPRSDVRSKSAHDDTRDRAFSIDEELYEEDEDMLDESKPSPFQRSARKSMFLDGRWGQWEEILETMNLADECEVPAYNGDNNPVTEPHSPQVKTNNNCEEEEDSVDNLHVVELLRGDEPLGIHLVSYTSEGRDLGVFIESLDDEGFAAKSGKLAPSDRILACNGEDFTQELNSRVEERFREMAAKEPLLRMAISRGFVLNLKQSESTNNMPTDSSETNNNDVQQYPSGETLSPPTTVAANPMSNVFTNTRQIGVKHTIEISRSPTGTFGFGLSSRDVSTNDEDQPIYVKSITTDGPAFNDGRLKIGDRLLEVNGISVKGLSQSEAVSLLRASGDKVILLVSRQEIVETQDEEFNDENSTEPLPLVSSVGKSLMVFDISLSNGIASLGVIVHGRCSSKKKHASDMGIYIKSIVPGGAAARDGRLKVHDQLICVNNEAVVNMSNRDAMEALKKELSQADPHRISSVKLTIARTSGINRKHNLSMSSFASQMPALKEEERPDPDGGRVDKTIEMGIDCPKDMINSPSLSPELELTDHYDTYPQHEDDSLMLSHSSIGSQGSFSNSRFDPSMDYKYRGVDIDTRSLEYNHFGSKNEPSPLHSTKQQQQRYSALQHSSNSTPRHIEYSHNSMDRINYKKHSTPNSQNGASGNSRNRGGYHHSDLTGQQHHSYIRQDSISPTSDKPRWLANSLDNTTRSSQSPKPPYTRSASVHSELSMHSQPNLNQRSHYMSQNLFSTEIHSTSSMSLPPFTKSRENSFRRKASPPYDTLAEPTSPILIKDKNSSYTLPRATGSGSKYTISERGNYGDDISLMSYNSDPELNPFQRDHIARKSIPKKKNTPQPNLSHLQLANMIPRLEGEGSPSPPLYRTGSDSDVTAINHNNHFYNTDMLRGVEVGPNLRMAKSSSLESLQTVMHYTINADVRGRNSTRNSFRRAVDRSYSQSDPREDNIPSSTVISLSKNPKKKSRKSLFGWITLKSNKKSTKPKKEKRRSRIPSQDLDFSQNSIDQLAKEFGISLDTIRRMQSHSGNIEGDEEKEREAERERQAELERYNSRQHDNTFESHNIRAL